MKSMPCKCKKPGAFILHLKGILELLDTKKIPNSPLGASITQEDCSLGITKPSVYNLKWCIKIPLNI